MNYQVYKITENANGYFYNVISHVDNIDLDFSIAENFAATSPENPINQSLTSEAGWDNIDVKPTTISPLVSIVTDCTIILQKIICYRV